MLNVFKHFPCRYRYLVENIELLLLLARSIGTVVQVFTRHQITARRTRAATREKGDERRDTDRQQYSSSRYRGIRLRVSFFFQENDVRIFEKIGITKNAEKPTVKQRVMFPAKSAPSLR